MQVFLALGKRVKDKFRKVSLTNRYMVELGLAWPGSMFSEFGEQWTQVFFMSINLNYLLPKNKSPKLIRSFQM